MNMHPAAIKVATDIQAHLCHSGEYIHADIAQFIDAAITEAAAPLVEHLRDYEKNHCYDLSPVTLRCECRRCQLARLAVAAFEKGGA